MKGQPAIALAPAHLCTGCTACLAVCPASAIRMDADSEGFSYPRIDDARCTRCGLCVKTCPVLRRPPPRQPLAVYAALSADAALREQSSSGGLFTLLARRILSQDGVVFGAAWGEGWGVAHVSAADEAGLAALRGSKYAQSDLRDVFRQVRQHLCDGRPVLFSGTPCQLAGLRAFLSTAEPADAPALGSLLGVDLVCYSVPSPRAFDAYRRERETLAGAPAVRISFRDKRDGWHRYALAMSFANGASYRASKADDSFLQGFTKDLFSRPSCHACPFRELRSGADITLGDFWGVAQRHPDFDDDRGTSLLLANTHRGLAFVQAVLSLAGADAPRWRAESDYAAVQTVNWALCRSPEPHRNRAAFFENLERVPFSRLVRRLLRPSLSRRLRAALRRMRKPPPSQPAAPEAERS